MKACRPWLEAELAAIGPKIIVCLGATAAQSLLGSRFRVTQERGRMLANTELGTAGLATVHPSSILRAPTEAERQNAYTQFVADLRAVAGWLARN